MGFDVGEWTLVPLIQSGIQAVQADLATQVPLIFPQAPSALQAQIITSLSPGGGLATVGVQLAYLPTTTPTLPAVYCYEVPGGEDASHDMIGSLLQSVPVTDTNGAVTGWDTDIGILTRKAWQFTCATINITDLLVLRTLVLNAFVSARPQLGALPNRYMDQTLSWSGWGRMTNSAGDVIFPFQQTVTLTITVLADALASTTDLVTGWTPSALTPE